MSFLLCQMCRHIQYISLIIDLDINEAYNRLTSISINSKFAGFTNRTDTKIGPLSVSPMGGLIFGSPL